MIEFCDLQIQQARLREQIDAGIRRVLEHGRYILGPEVGELEERLAAFVGVAHCITCANGTDALQIAQMALGVGPGSEVITPGFAYIASAETVALLGARPVYVDIDPRTCTLDPARLAAAITPRTRAIIAVSLYGQCADFAAIEAIARRHAIALIEDAAQSFGASQRGRRSGSFGAVACSSFFPSKPLGCYGDGGALFTDDAQLARVLRQIARHGEERRYQHVRLGLNSRLDTLQAAILLAKLSVFEEEIELRQQVAHRYHALLAGAGGEPPACVLATPHVAAHNTSVYAQYTLRVSRRAAVQARLAQAGVPSAVHYPLALHRQPAVADASAQLPHSDQAAEQVLSLPMHPYLGEVEQRVICAALDHA